MGPCLTAEGIKPTGANGEGGVEFTGVFCVGLLLLTLQAEWGTCHICGSHDSWETCPVPSGLTPWSQKASWPR